jgi:hypothetical protein
MMGAAISQEGGAVEVAVSAESTATPAQVLASLTDFSPRRAELFADVDGGGLEIHSTTDTTAEVTEGSKVPLVGRVWERNRYDWSTPGLLLVETVNSNTWALGSRWLYRLEALPSGGTRVDLHVVRIPQGRRGRIVLALVRLGGARRFRANLQRTLKVPPVGIEPTSTG